MGGSGGLFIIPAVLQVFLNHFVLRMEPLTAVESPRVYHKVLNLLQQSIHVYLLLSGYYDIPSNT